MELKRGKSVKLSEQLKRSSEKEAETRPEYDGDETRVISTGSTLLDLAISGGRIHGGGLPAGIVAELYGPAGCGKTVMLSEILGSVQRRGGRGLFLDTEARADLEFMRMFGVDLTKVRYKAPDTVTEVFKMVREWMPKDADEVIHGVFLDSLAALSTNMEMTEEEGDKMGGRRAKEFSQEFRRTTRLIKSSGLLLVCSNQVRENMNAGSWGKKLISPGGKALEHYISLKLFFSSAQKIKKKKTVKGKEVTRVVGVEANIEVEKSSIWMPFRSAPVIIIFDYGVDDVQANLKWLKALRGDKVYTVRGRKLSNSLDAAIAEVEEDNLEKRLREDVINQWEEVEEKFHEDRKTKRRFD